MSFDNNAVNKIGSWVLKLANFTVGRHILAYNNNILLQKLFQCQFIM